MDIQIETVNPTEPAIKTPTSTAHTQVEHLAIAERFNITTPTKDENDKLSAIWSYAKQLGPERPMSDVIWDVINLEQTLGSPKLGETRLDKLYRYVNLRIQEGRIKEQLKDVTDSVNIYK